MKTFDENSLDTLKMQVSHMQADLLEMRISHQRLVAETQRRNAAIDEMLSVYEQMHDTIMSMVDSMLSDEGEADWWKQGTTQPDFDEEDSE